MIFKNLEHLMNTIISSSITFLIIIFCIAIILILSFVLFKAKEDINYKRGLKNEFLNLYLNTFFKISLKNELNEVYNKNDIKLESKKTKKQKLFFKKIEFDVFEDHVHFKIQTNHISTIKFLENNNKENLVIIRKKIESTLSDYNFSDFVPYKQGYALSGTKK